MSKGMITANGLIKALIDDINNNYANDKQKLNQYYISKLNFFALIKQKVPNLETDKNYIVLKDKLLYEQELMLRKYFDNLPRINRIIDVLKKSQNRISDDNKKEFKFVLKFLKEFHSVLNPSAFSGGLIKIIALQKQALEKKDFKKFNNLFKKEIRKIRKLAKSLDAEIIKEAYSILIDSTKRKLMSPGLVFFPLIVIVVFNLSYNVCYADSSNVDNGHYESINNNLRSFELGKILEDNSNASEKDISSQLKPPVKMKQEFTNKVGTKSMGLRNISIDAKNLDHNKIELRAFLDKNYSVSDEDFEFIDKLNPELCKLLNQIKFKMEQFAFVHSLKKPDGGLIKLSMKILVKNKDIYRKLNDNGVLIKALNMINNSDLRSIDDLENVEKNARSLILKNLSFGEKVKLGKDFLFN